ncbi:MAG: hypothetical protein IPO82_10765 [Betaproteobacteria bacterium]|nr:hypothetical protein [Betaproteobacteria bacterium]
MKHALITLKSALAGLLATLIIGFFVGAIGEAAAAETTAALFTPAPGDTAATARLAEKRASGKPHVARQRAVGINFPSLEPREGRRSVALTVELFDGVALLADLDRIEIRGAQSYSWFGRIRGLPNSRATLTVVKGVLAGNLIVLDDWHRVKGSYQIESAGDGLYLLEEIDPSAFPEDHPPGIDLQPPIPPMRLDGPTPRVNEKSGATVTVDVMVVYSSQTASAAGSAIDAQIQAAVDSANSIYANSGVDTRLRLVYSGPASYSQSGDFYTDLDRLTGTGDGAMDNVHALRDAYGADMVSLWIETGTYCGLGWIGPSASYAFTVVNRGCATSNSTFAHELGHNMGALHDPYVDSSTYPYSYGHGHVNLVARWRTVMSYNDQCAATAPGTSCTRIPYFSNPNLTYGGAPLGTAAAGSTPTADNARVHNQVAATVAAFRPTAAGPQCTYALSPTAASPASTGGSATVSVTTQAGCAWTATSSASWLTISGATSGTGNGTVSYATSANTGAARSATLSIGGSTVTVTQAALICSYSLSPGSSSVAAAASGGTVAVSAPTGCAWTAASSASWLTVTAGASGSGNGTVTYAAATNTGTTRTANLTVGGQTFTVTQATGCTYAVSPSSISTAATAGSGTVAVTSGTGCGWTAASSASWLTVTSGASGSGNGTVAYSTGANAGGVRTATLTIGGNAVTVTQAAQSCSYTLSPASGSFTAAGGTGTATMNVSAGCAWTAASNASWLTVTAGATGSGNGSVSYSAAVNTGPARAANLTIGGKVFPVTQATGCTYSVSPTSISATAAASNGIVAVTSGSGCSWTATSGAGWLTVGSGASGTGNGTVGYTVSANDGTARTATLIVGGNAVTVTQDAPTTPPATDVPWIEDAVPQGASLIADVDSWQWAGSNPAPFSGTLAHQSALAAGIHQHYFYNATPTTTMAVGAGDTLFAYVYLDPANPPDTVMLQWNDGTWEHRAYWGANLTPWGTDGTPSRRPMGALPAAGRWVRLEVPAAQVGLEGRTVNGMAFTLHGGRATWDYAGKRTSAPSPIHQMSGVVTHNGAALSGVAMTAAGGAGCTPTNAAGAYSCTVPAGWTGTVTPGLPGYGFTPASRSYTNVTGSLAAQDYGAIATATTTTTVPWIEDAVPQGALLIADVDSWQWTSSNPAPFSGALAHPSALAAGIHQHYFYNATPTTTMAVGAGDTLFAYVYLDPANPPDTVMLQWNDGTWEHRAYWGANVIPWGTDGTPSRRPMGALPAAGQWVRLEVSAAQVGLEGRTVNGMAFTLHGGRATWDYAGKRTSAPSPIHQMSGVVTHNGAALSGVAMTAAGGAGCTPTNAAGAYSCTVPAGWTGTVTPGLPGYGFTPASRSYTNVTGSLAAQDYGAIATATTTTTVPWIEDAVPQGASLIADVDSWQWTSSNPAPFSGALAHPSALAAGIHQHYFYNATPTTTMAVGAGDTLFAYVYLDPANPPDTVMLQWNDGTWEHRAYWGANVIPWGTDGTPSRRSMGALPAAGQWVRLEVSAAQVGLEGRTVNGMAFTLHGGRATWDYAGKVVH